MESAKRGCTENINVSADRAHGDMPEECWTESYRGDSRKWLIRDASRGETETCSTMKETYPFPDLSRQRVISERRAMLLQQFYDEATEEIIRERNEPPPVEEYCTEYLGNYHIAGFHPEKPHVANKDAQELYEKYPLHSSPVMSFWQYKISQNDRAKLLLPGLTPSIDLKSPFKRNSTFTRPLAEVFDELHLN